MIAIRPNYTKILRLGTYLFFILSLSLQANLGYAATGCSMSDSGAVVCHSGSSSATDVHLQNPCCCPEITQCLGMEVVATGDVAQATASKWDAGVPGDAHSRCIKARRQPGVFRYLHAEPEIVKPPLHILNRTLLI